MTSQLILVNQLAVAVASDTLTSRRSQGDTKTWPSASKIVELPSPATAVVLHCGDVFVGHTSWRLLVREWTRRSGDLSAPTTVGLRDAFATWVSANHDLLGLTDDDGVWCRLGPYEAGRGHLGWLANDLPDDLRRAFVEDSKANDAALAAAIRHCVDEWYATDPFPDLDVEAARALIASAEVDVSANFRLAMGQDEHFQVHEETTAALGDFAVAALRCIPSWERAGTDLHFVGFGTDEALGQVARLTVLGFWGGELRTTTGELGSTVPGAYPVIYPIAQSTAIDAFWTGTSGDVDRAIERAARTALGTIDGVTPEQLDRAISSMDDELMAFSNDRYRDPMFQTIGGLGISNLGKFADFLIHLQSFRAATDEGEATVGGFVESLVITPERGVQWRHRISDGIHEISNSSHAFE